MLPGVGKEETLSDDSIEGSIGLCQVALRIPREVDPLPRAVKLGEPVTTPLERDTVSDTEGVAVGPKLPGVPLVHVP